MDLGLQGKRALVLSSSRGLGPCPAQLIELRQQLRFLGPAAGQLFVAIAERFGDPLQPRDRERESADQTRGGSKEKGKGLGQARTRG